MLGNCATGKLRMVSEPTNTSTMEITIATMGRLIKNVDMALPARGFGDEWFGIDVSAGANLLDAFGHDVLSRLQSFSDNPLAANVIADLYSSYAHLVVR